MRQYTMMLSNLKFHIIRRSILPATTYIIIYVSKFCLVIIVFYYPYSFYTDRKWWDKISRGFVLIIYCLRDESIEKLILQRPN